MESLQGRSRLLILVQAFLGVEGLRAPSDRGADAGDVRLAVVLRAHHIRFPINLSTKSSSAKSFADANKTTCTRGSPPTRPPLSCEGSGSATGPWKSPRTTLVEPEESCTSACVAICVCASSSRSQSADPPAGTLRHALTTPNKKQHPHTHATRGGSGVGGPVEARPRKVVASALSLNAGH